ncbi:bifunctional 3'-5' exonuclease/ATP-dependent helicase WRN-like [Oculina patagonica]
MPGPRNVKKICELNAQQKSKGSQLFNMYAPNSRGKQEESLRRGFQTSNTAFFDMIIRSHSRSASPPLLQEPAKTIQHELTRPFEALGVKVVYTNDVFEAESWLKAYIVDCSARAIGFDIEWKPQFVRKKNGGIENKTAVLQLGVEKSCLVLHIYHMSELPELLISILRDENILKVGVDTEKDALKLHRDKGLVCEGMADIQAMAMKSLGIPASAPKLGLKTLAKRFLGIELEKSKEVAISDWENFPLQLKQIEYAALDAWAGVKIYKAMSPQSCFVYYVLRFTLFILLFYALLQFYKVDIK